MTFNTFQMFLISISLKNIINVCMHTRHCTLTHTHTNAHSLMPHTHIHINRPSGNPGKCQKVCSWPWLAENLFANWKIGKYLWKNMRAAGHGHSAGYKIIKCSVQWNQCIVAKEQSMIQWWLLSTQEGNGSSDPHQSGAVLSDVISLEVAALCTSAHVCLEGLDAAVLWTYGLSSMHGRKSGPVISLKYCTLKLFIMFSANRLAFQCKLINFLVFLCLIHSFSLLHFYFSSIIWRLIICLFIAALSSQ